MGGGKMNQFSRTQLLLGTKGMQSLHAARVAIFGIGGVGGYAAEALVRSGIGAIDLYDDDRICIKNLNRQLVATRKTVGEYKVDAMTRRLLEINPNLLIDTKKYFTCLVRQKMLTFLPMITLWMLWIR